MAIPSLPPDFREFLRLLDSFGVEYLLVGGYAVGYHGYPRATADMDVWIGIGAENAARTVAALRAFGFDLSVVQPALFLAPDQIIRLGRPPFRIEILTGVSGVRFEDCYRARVTARLDDIDVAVISLDDLKANKRAAARHKDLDDLEHLP